MIDHLKAPPYFRDCHRNINLVWPPFFSWRLRRFLVSFFTFAQKISKLKKKTSRKNLMGHPNFRDRGFFFTCFYFYLLGPSSS